MASNKKLYDLPLDTLGVIQSYLSADDVRSLKQVNKNLSRIPLMECSNCEENPQECLWDVHMGCIKKMVIEDPEKFFYVLEYLIKDSDEVYDFVEWYDNFRPLNKHDLAKVAILTAETLNEKLMEWTISKGLYNKLTDQQKARLLMLLMAKAFYFNGVEDSIDYVITLDYFPNYIGDVASDMLDREDAQIIMDNHLAKYSDLGASHNREENELDTPYWVDEYERLWKESMIFD